MSVKDHYQEVIREIMREYGIQPIQPKFGHVIPKHARFKEVVQYTDYYAGKGNDEQPNSALHYRYERYLDALRRLDMIEPRKANIDIGCGAGVFSWPFLDWATANSVGLKDVDLYGYDPCPAMINLAQDIRNRLQSIMPDYPALHYYCDVTNLLHKLQENHQAGTDYVITLGHVLVQAHDDDTIGNITQVTVHVLEMMANLSDCALVAVDAKGMAIDLRLGWESLLNRLRDLGIRYDLQLFMPTINNNDSCAKIAMPYTE